MANISISGLPAAAAVGGEVFVGNQSGTTKKLTLNTSALSDSESGTFTPTLYGLTAAGITTYTQQQGHYEKIGRFVIVSLTVTWTNATGTGQSLIGGLPFLSAILTGTIRHPLNVACYNGLSLPAGTLLGGFLPENTNYIRLLNLSNTGSADFTDLQSELTTSGEIYASMTYLV